MSNILKGKPVIDALASSIGSKSEELKAKGILPTLAIVRVGEKDSDISYEKSATKRAELCGIRIENFIYEESISEEKLIEEIQKINEDDSIHGVLLFRPLPDHMDDDRVRNSLDEKKDVDGITDASMAGVFTGNGVGYPPCTPSACMEIIKHYGIEVSGKNVTIVGRSLVVGKPLAMMMMALNATVTVCHSRTPEEELNKACTNADILVAAVGRPRVISDKNTDGQNQTIIDVGINVDESGKLCGDVDFESLDGKAEAITPVPGGVGGVTSAVLMKHVVQAADAY